MKPLFVFILLSISIHPLCLGQMCPGGGTDFANAITFQPAWIYGCNTGTSCNGGVNFDNRIACEPTGPIDACAPAPTCSAQTTGSDIWFAFYASQTVVNLASFQNTSLVIGIQAFSGGTTCGSLTTIGCAVSGGPSSGVILTLTGLTIGQRYFFRVFGSSNNISQRSGLYCFCGTTGVEEHLVSSSLKSFTATNKNQYNYLNWTMEPNYVASYVDIQKSIDGHRFFTVRQVTLLPNHADYSFSEEANESNAVTYYRLATVRYDGGIEYSQVLTIKSKTGQSVDIVSNIPGRPVVIEINTFCHLQMYNSSGNCVQSISLSKGQHVLSTEGLARGVYFLKDATGYKTRKIVVM